MPRETNRLRIFCLVSLLLCALAPGCADDDGHGIVGPDPGHWARLYDWTDPETWTDPSRWPDDKLLSFAYSTSRGHPDFYREDPDRGSRYYENTISTRRETDQWIELATDNRDSALAWSERAARTGAYYRDLVAETETEKYYEFRRVRAANPRDVILSRVHKIGYLDRSMFDRLRPSPVLGVFGPRPIDAAKARELIEYMWVNSRIVGFGRPLSRELIESAGGFAEEIFYSYTIGGDWGLCDTIVLGRAVVSVDRTSGEITAVVEELREVTGVCYE